MKIRLRGPTGATILELSKEDSIDRLLEIISERTKLSHFEIKYGYPPQTLSLANVDTTQSISVLSARLDGEQLIISPTSPPRSESPRHQSTQSRTDSNSAFNADNSHQTKAANYQNSLNPPELPIESHKSTMVLRIMPDDNSCLFRAFGSAFFGFLDSMTELRSLVAQSIQGNPEKYSEAVLDQKPDDYCIWIQTEDAWGGGIELSILSQHFEVEICSIDVQTLRVDRFNEGKPQRCILVYSGIHYDVIALSPSEPPYRSARAPPEMDRKLFDSSDDALLIRALDICRILNSKHYFTDTAGFSVRCSECQALLKGTKGAQEHRSLTGHTKFEETG